MIISRIRRKPSRLRRRRPGTASAFARAGRLVQSHKYVIPTTLGIGPPGRGRITHCARRSGRRARHGGGQPLPDREMDRDALLGDLQRRGRGGGPGHLLRDHRKARLEAPLFPIAVAVMNSIALYVLRQLIADSSSGTTGAIRTGVTSSPSGGITCRCSSGSRSWSSCGSS